MRKRVLGNSLAVQFSYVCLFAVLVVAALSGCGGGGGGGNNNGGGGTSTPGLATVTGKVVASDGTTPVANITISIVGTALTAQSGSTGTFTIFNVPLTATAFTFSTTGTNFNQYGTYQGVAYGTNLSGVDCPLPLPTLVAGSNPLPANIEVFSNSSPPPPPSNCPAG